MPYSFPREPGCSLCGSWLGEQEATVVAATEQALCLVPRRTRSAGAVVVVPRRHVRSSLDLTADEAEEIALLTRSVAAMIESAYDPIGFNIWWAIGELAGQETEHLIVELAPRLESAPYQYVEWRNLPEAALATRCEVAAKLRRAGNGASRRD
ncbi:MAG TPA: HIT domain-containing protein [Thermoanaerobaculia bacterium]|nr:HIT domain-containing protein [Thermoanaerobaculia bacterium]